MRVVSTSKARPHVITPRANELLALDQPTPTIVSDKIQHPTATIALHARAHLKRLDENDEVVDIPSEKFLQIVREGTPTADQAAIRRNRILNIDVLHPEQAALATVQVTLPPKTYTDFLSLLKCAAAPGSVLWQRVAGTTRPCFCLCVCRMS